MFLDNTQNYITYHAITSIMFYISEGNYMFYILYEDRQDIFLVTFLILFVHNEVNSLS